jgi:CAAX prenyl protease-like protein
MAAFVALTGLERGGGASYVWLYSAKVCVVTALLAYFRQPWREIRPSIRDAGPGTLVGVCVLAEWILLDRWLHYPHLGARTGFNPYAALPHPAGRTLFLVVRLYGLALLVPVMEEIFWRSFLLRYFTQPDWQAVPPGAYSWGAFVLVGAGFGASHPEWLAAILCACAYALLLRRTRSLFSCIVAHATTNLGLGIYVLATHAWQYW